MASQKGRWASMRAMFCCFVRKDAANPDPPQPQSCNSSDSSDPESIPDQPIQYSPPQVLSQVKNLSRWEDREVMYQKCIEGLEQELKMALKTNKALSGHLYEMGCLAFPEMEPCDSISPSFAEKLKVYLESLQLERRQLERRALRAEQTVWEMENEGKCFKNKHAQDAHGADNFLMHSTPHHLLLKSMQSSATMAALETRLRDSSCRGMHRMDRSFMPGRPPTQPMRSFFSKIHKKSPEKMLAVRSPGQQAKESFGEVVSSKLSTGKEAPSKVPWEVPPSPGQTEVKRFLPYKKRDVFTEPRLPQTICHSRPGSCHTPLERPGSSSSREFVGHGDICVAQIHGHWDAHEGRKQDECTKGAEDDSLSTTSTLPGTTLLRGGSENIKISPDSSVSLDIGPALQGSKISEQQHLASQSTEGNCETGRQGEGVTSKQEERVPLESACLKSVGLAGQVFEGLSHAQTDLQKQDDLGAKTFQDLPGQAALLTEIDLPGKDSLEFGRHQNINMMPSSDQVADLEPRTSQALSAEQAPCSLVHLQKPEEHSPLNPSLKADLPPSSIKSLEINCALADERALEDAPELTNKAAQSIPMEDDPSVALLLKLKPGELLLSGPSEALTSSFLESPQPASLTEESPSSTAEETAVEEH